MQSFEAGQAWAYATRANEQRSRIVICLVEPHADLGEIVHIQVNELNFKNKHAATGFSSKIEHMPYSASALRESGITFDGFVNQIPDITDGYQQWKTEFDKGDAGIWSVPVSEAVERMEQTLNQ